jgi:hypothetical protein
MSDLRTAAQQALEALTAVTTRTCAGTDGMDITPINDAFDMADTAITAIKTALEQPEQEPVAYLYHDAQSAHDANPMLHSTLLVMATERRPEYRNETPLYTHPPRREWRSLSEEEIYPLYSEPSSDAEMVEFARAIEAALRSKNYE